MEDYPKSVSRQCTQKILEQMSHNFIYKINKIKEIYDTGFFCYIKLSNKKIPVIIINNYIINEDLSNSINVLINNELKKIKLTNNRYINKELNISMIEIKEYENYNINFIEIDDNLYKKDIEFYYSKESIYIIQYNNEKDISVSYGTINDINKSQLIYSGNINLNSYGSPIFNLSNNKLIGIHCIKSKYYNKGIFFKYIIDGFIKEFFHEVNIMLDIQKEDINNKIYFLSNYYYHNYKEDNNLFIRKEDDLNKNNILNELNDYNSELYINNKSYKYKKYFKPEKKGEYNILLKFRINLINCSYMFAGCKKIKEIKFISLNTNYLKNMKCMFYRCENLENINSSVFNIKKSNDTSFMFYNCFKLNDLDLSSFNIKNVKNISYMFYGCNNFRDKNLMKYEKNEISLLAKIEEKDINQKIYFLDNSYAHDKLRELDKKNTELYINNKKYEYNKYFEPESDGIYLVTLKFKNIYIKNCSNMFYNCKNIINIDLSFFNYKNMKNLSYMFCGCHLLKSLQYISNWDTKNVTDMSYMLNKCSSLVTLSDISNWNTKNVNLMFGMFYNCSSLKSLPDISKWNTKNVKDMSYMFNNCSSLISLPDISKWNINNVQNMSYMFANCSSLISLPDISKWKISGNKIGMFDGCILLKSLP